MVWSPPKYGRFKKLPVSPRSTNISACLGKISRPASPRRAAQALRNLCISAAGIGSLVNRKTCAPPDLLRHTTIGSSRLLTFLIRPTWSSGYWSMSIQPQMQELSALIGIIPRLGSTPSRCLVHRSSVGGLRTTTALPACFPSPRDDSILYVP